MNKWMTAEEVRKLLGEACVPTQKAWSETHEIAESYVSAVLAGKIEPGPAILKALGLERVTVYRKAV